jgi:hypothetical protein
MRFTVIALSDNRDSFGLQGVILRNDEGKYFEAGLSSSAKRLTLGETLDIPPLTFGYYGLDWAAVSMEIPRMIQYSNQTPSALVNVESEKPTPKVCLHLERLDEEGDVKSVFMMRCDAMPHYFGYLRAVVRHYQLFGAKRPDRVQVYPV